MPEIQMWQSRARDYHACICAVIIYETRSSFILRLIFCLNQWYINSLIKFDKAHVNAISLIDTNIIDLATTCVEDLDLRLRENLNSGSRIFPNEKLKFFIKEGK